MVGGGWWVAAWLSIYTRSSVNSDVLHSNPGRVYAVELATTASPSALHDPSSITFQWTGYDTEAAQLSGDNSVSVKITAESRVQVTCALSFGGRLGIFLTR
jgi:hypothetical protein